MTAWNFVKLFWTCRVPVPEFLRLQEVGEAENRKNWYGTGAISEQMLGWVHLVTRMPLTGMWQIGWFMNMVKEVFHLNCWIFVGTFFRATRKKWSSLKMMNRPKLNYTCSKTLFGIAHSKIDFAEICLPNRLFTLSLRANKCFLKVYINKYPWCGPSPTFYLKHISRILLWSVPIKKGADFYVSPEIIKLRNGVIT